MAIQIMGRLIRTRRPTRPLRGAPVGGSYRQAHALYQELVRLVTPATEDARELAAWLATNPDASEAYAALMSRKDKWRRVLGPSASALAYRWTRAVSDRDKIKLQVSLAKALGVEVVSIFDEPAVQGVEDMMRTQAIPLISSISDVYYDKVLEATMRSYQQLPLPENRNLVQEIQELTKITFERAKLIAVDQTQKMHGMVTQSRQTALGIEEYVWRTSKDQRVVGNPNGLYPNPTKLHGNHYIRNGKIYRWDSPPSDGHPGWPIRCRCMASPVIDYRKLKLVA